MKNWQKNLLLLLLLFIPLNIFCVVIHEYGHALACIATGGVVDHIDLTMSIFGGGGCWCSGGNGMLITMGGFFATTILAVLFIRWWWPLALVFSCRMLSGMINARLFIGEPYAGDYDVLTNPVGCCLYGLCIIITFVTFYMSIKKAYDEAPDE